MSFELAPIVKQAELVRALVERAVGRWTKRYKYTHGDENRASMLAGEILAGIGFFALLVAFIVAMGVAQQWSGT